MESGPFGEAFDGVAHRAGEGGASVGLGGLVEGLNGLAGYEGSGGVVDKDKLGVFGECFECGEDGLLPGSSTDGVGDFDAFWQLSGDLFLEGGFLGVIADGDDGLLDSAALGELTKGVEKDGLSGERGEDLVGDRSFHASAAAGGEEDEPVHFR